MTVKMNRSYLTVAVMACFGAAAAAQNLPEPMVSAARKAVVSNPEVQARWNAFKAAGNERDVARGREPVRAGDRAPVRGGVGRAAPAVVAGEEARRRQLRGRERRDALHAVFAVLEMVDHLAGHRDRVRCVRKAGPARVRGLEHAFELGGAQPQRAGPLRGIAQAAALPPGGLHVGATDVPADHGALRHGRSRGAPRHNRRLPSAVPPSRR